jgi:hypothetical protein
VTAAGVLLATLASQVAVLTAILYYIGWVRSQATFAYFGIDPGLVGYSTADYILRSLNSAFPPLIVGALVVMGGVFLHDRGIRPLVDRAGRPAFVIALLCRVLGIGLAAVVLARILIPILVTAPSGLMLPLTLLLSVFMLAYADQLGCRRTPHAGATTPFSLKVRMMAIVGLGLVGAFWALALYAQSVGELRARQIESELSDAPGVVVYSKSPLLINGLGVQGRNVGVDGDQYRHVYTGLRLVGYGNNKYVLIAVGWHKGESAYLLPDNESVRIDVVSR